MDVREKMVYFRRNGGVTLKEMAQRCHISEGLLGMIEDGEVTHPIIAKRIGEVYGFSEEETEELVPLHRRPNGGCYDPDRYVDPDPIFHNQTGDRLHSGKAVVLP